VKGRRGFAIWGMGIAVLATLALAAVLAACGSGGGGTTSTSTAAPGSSAPRTAKAPPGQAPAKAPAAGTGASHAAAPLTRASARRAERHAEALQAAHHRALAKKAGHAASFLVPTGDNSVPTYGSEASSSQQAAATVSLQAYLQARASGDWSAACAQMATTVQKQLALLAGGPGAKAEGCAAAYAKLSSRVPASARANPLSGPLAAFRVKADKAFALFYGPHRRQYMMPMVSEGGAWKVSQLEPIPWPIGAPTGSR
jgi:hypothetical protein